MGPISVSVFLALALVLGMRHALDPDHVVAVSTLAAEERRVRPVAFLGLIWGLGHLVPLVLIGIPVIVLRLELPGAIEGTVDLGVGLLLFGLGIRTIRKFKQERVHFHLHQHDEEVQHAHFHRHREGPGHGTHEYLHPLPASKRRAWTVFLVGMMHGLAGTGATAVLALATSPDLAVGVGYLLIFGAGTCLGMFLMTLCIAAPAVAGANKYQRIYGFVRIGAGIASIVLGILLWVEKLPELIGHYSAG